MENRFSPEIQILERVNQGAFGLGHGDEEWENVKRERGQCRGELEIQAQVREEGHGACDEVVEQAGRIELPSAFDGYGSDDADIDEIFKVQKIKKTKKAVKGKGLSARGQKEEEGILEQQVCEEKQKEKEFDYAEGP